MSTVLSSSDTIATNADLSSNLDATNPTTLISSSQEQNIASKGSLKIYIPDSKSTPSYQSHALSSLPSNGRIASSGFLTHGYGSLQGVPSKTYGSLVTGVTAASRLVTTTGSSNNVTAHNYIYWDHLAVLQKSGGVLIEIALQTARALVPAKQAAASSTDTAQPSQLVPSLAPVPSPSQTGTADPDPQPPTGQQQNNPNAQAASLPGSDTHGPAGADISASDSVLKLPSEPAVSTMMIAGAPVVNSQGSLKVQGTPLAAGATIALSGTIWSLSPSSPPNSINLNVGGTTYNIPQMTLPPITTIVGHEVQALGPSAIAIDGQALTQGAPSLLLSSSVPVIFGSSNLVIGTSTIPIQPQIEAPIPSILNLAGGQSLTQVLNNPNAYLISGTTLLPGSPAAIISGTSYSLAPSGALILGTSTIPIATAGSNAATGILTAGSEVFTPLGSTAVAVNGATLSLNGPESIDHGTVLSLGPGGLVVGSSTYAFATPAAAATEPSAAATTQQFPITTVLSAGGHTFTANPSGFSIAGTTLSPGSPGITVAGTRISLGASGILDIGSSTTNLSPTALTVADQTFTPKPTAFSIAGTTLTAGGPGITISGTLISLGTSGLLDIGGSTIELSSPTAYTIAGQTFTPNPTAFSVDGTTITAGGPGVTISGTPILLQPGGELVIGSSTIPLSAYTIAGQTFTPNPTAFSIDGTTITAGGPGLNINGTSILLEPGGKLVIGNTTFSLPASNLASTTFPPSLTTSSIDASSTNIAPGHRSTSAIGGGAGATKTGKKVHGGAVGTRCKRSWWEVVGFVGFWMMMTKALL